MYAFNMILLLGVAFAIVDLCAGSRVPTSMNFKPKTCSYTDPKVSVVNVNPCKEAPCILHEGVWYNLTVAFITKRPVHDGIFQLDYREGHHWTNLKLSRVCRLCDQLKGSYCPLKAGARAVYKAPDFHVETGPHHDKIKTKKHLMRFSMADGRGKTVFCFLLYMRARI